MEKLNETVTEKTSACRLKTRSRTHTKNHIFISIVRYIYRRAQHFDTIHTNTMNIHKKRIGFGFVINTNNLIGNRRHWQSKEVAHWFSVFLTEKSHKNLQIDQKIVGFQFSQHIIQTLTCYMAPNKKEPLIVRF